MLPAAALGSSLAAPVESAVSWAAGGTRCPCGRAGHVLGRANAALAFLGCVISDARWELSWEPRSPVPAQAGLHIPAAGGARGAPCASCHLAGLSSLVHPLEVALRCDSHRARRRGLVRGHRGEELRMAVGRPCGTGPAPGCASLLPRGFLGAPPTPPHGLAVAETRMLSLLEVPIPPPDVPLYPSLAQAGCSCGDRAAGRAETPKPAPRWPGLSPQP